VPKAGAGSRAANDSAKAAGRRTPRRITPEQALDNTRILLEAKHARDRETPPWQALGTDTGAVPAPHYQSDDARVQANALHQGEADLDAIQGSISSTDRHTQGKRDSR
jgi:hypothetical protein